MTKAMIIKLIYTYAIMYDINPHLVISVVGLESNFKINAIGSKHEIGLLQLMPTSFPQYTKNQLLKPELNLKLGIEYMAKMKKECVHKDNNNWLTCFNVGPDRAKLIKHPNKYSYVMKVNKYVNNFNYWKMENK